MVSVFSNSLMQQWNLEHLGQPDLKIAPFSYCRASDIFIAKPKAELNADDKKFLDNGRQRYVYRIITSMLLFVGICRLGLSILSG
jgi:hypothetical protein